MRADQTLFMRSDELRDAWRWIDGIIDGWRHVGQCAEPYISGSIGPSDAIALLVKDGRQWQDYHG